MAVTPVAICWSPSQPEATHPGSSFVVIGRSGGRPAEDPRIAERFVTAIALGQFVPGQRLPTERELAAMLSVSRATARSSRLAGAPSRRR
ncbi:MAG TPA: GntR family transcriptional regulator [Streptosporangiaceae bacterium]|nr:GntR family transcriptional regulator [Streptosporangiaceae bacterium]